MEADWRVMDRAARSAAYDNRAAVPDGTARVARWSEQSAVLRRERPGFLDLTYGPRPRERVDLFPAERRDAPLLVFIHGGYWQRNAKEDFSCMASGPLARGMAVALVGYTLTPDATLTAIAAEVAACLAFLRERDAAVGVRRRYVVSGWSAGGHLAALSAPHADAVLAVSGLYDLAPLRGTTIDDAVRLTEAEVEALSPIGRTDRSDCPVVVAVGGRELPELRRQAAAYHEACAARGRAATLLTVADTDHFSVLDALVDPAGALTRAAVTLGFD